MAKIGSFELRLQEHEVPGLTRELALSGSGLSSPALTTLVEGEERQVPWYPWLPLKAAQTSPLLRHLL